MFKFLVLSAVALGVLAFSPASPARAFAPGQPSIAKAVGAMGDVILVRRSIFKPRPPGWSHGRKVGWRGFRVPPGQRR